MKALRALTITSTRGTGKEKEKHWREPEKCVGIAEKDRKWWVNTTEYIFKYFVFQLDSIIQRRNREVN